MRKCWCEHWLMIWYRLGIVSKRSVIRLPWRGQILSLLGLIITNLIGSRLITLLLCWVGEYFASIQRRWATLTFANSFRWCMVNVS